MVDLIWKEEKNRNQFKDKDELRKQMSKDLGIMLYQRLSWNTILNK